MKLSGEQNAGLEQLKSLYMAYQDQVREEEARHQYQMTQLREPVQRQVRNLRTIGVPEAQIYRGGLGMADYRTLDRFMVLTNGTPVAKIGQTISVPVETGYGRNVTVVKKHERQWDIIGTDGELWDTIDLADAGGVWVLSFYREVPAEIREAICAADNRAFYVTIVGPEGDEVEEVWNA